jgi:hypothetical protein
MGSLGEAGFWTAAIGAVSAAGRDLAESRAKVVCAAQQGVLSALKNRYLTKEYRKPWNLA